MIFFKNAIKAHREVCILDFHRIKFHDAFSKHGNDHKKYRMTYKMAGAFYRAMCGEMYLIDSVSLYDIHKMGLQLPDKQAHRFSDFIDVNADRLQLYDEPVIAVSVGGHVTQIAERRANG